MSDEKTERKPRKKTPFLVMKVHRDGETVYPEIIHTVKGTIADAERWINASKKDVAIQEQFGLKGDIEFLLAHAKKKISVDYGPVESADDECFDSLVSPGNGTSTNQAAPTVAPVQQTTTDTAASVPVEVAAPVAPAVAAAKPQATPAPAPAGAPAPVPAPAPAGAPAPVPAPAPVAASPLPNEFVQDSAAPPVPPAPAAPAMDVPDDGAGII